MPILARATGIWTRRQRAVVLLAWVLLLSLALWRLLRGPWPADLYILAAFATLYLLVRTAVVLRGEIPAWTEYAFLFIDAVLISAAIRIFNGIATDFYLAYFFVLAEGVLTLDFWIIVLPLSVFVALGYVAATWPALLGEETWDVLVGRLFFLVLVCVGAGWVASREAQHGREVASLREQLLLEEDRRQIAREIHDGLGSVLAGGTQYLELAERLLPIDSHRAAALLRDVRRLLRQGLDEIRLLVLGLRPLGPSAGDAVAAAREHLDALSARTQITTEVRCHASAIPLSPVSEFTFRRILQEALTNVARHARANRVTVTLARFGPSVTSAVADDGVGVTAADDGRCAGFGLQHMRERAAELGGTLEVSTTLGGGTTVTFTLPCQARSRVEGSGA
jgi:signal transduction histidine kinase